MRKKVVKLTKFVTARVLSSVFPVEICFKFVFGFSRGEKSFSVQDTLVSEVFF